MILNHWYQVTGGAVGVVDDDADDADADNDDDVQMTIYNGDG